jgi:hypothetical protein
MDNSRRKGELEEIATFEILRYAVQCALFCDACGAALDARHAVLVEVPNKREFVVCSGCWDARRVKLIRFPRRLQVIDGRNFLNSTLPASREPQRPKGTQTS